MLPTEVHLHINEAYLPALESRHRYLVLYGGAGSGKSHFAAQKLILRLLERRGHRILVVRKVARTIRHSCFRLLKDLIVTSGLRRLFSFNETEMTIRCVNGSEIVTSGLDDTEKLKSIAGITSIWIEEATELEPEEFEQVDLRLRGESPDYRQIILTFNPISKEHWLKARFVDLPGEDVAVFRTTYRDNAFIDPDYVKVLESLRDKDPHFWRVYALGEWGEPVEGFVFKREYYQEWDHVPADARGVVYCDPNLALKSKGDTTAVVKLLFSPTTGRYYVAEAVCRSFADPNELLSVVLSMRDRRVVALGFDGHVSQESTWTAHVRNWCRIHGVPFPPIEYKRYRVDELAKTVQFAYTDRLIYFPPDFGSTEDGARFLAQLWTFAGKKSSKEKDDAPDALICAFEFLHERGLARLAGSAEAYRVITVKDVY